MKTLLLLLSCTFVLTWWPAEQQPPAVQESVLSMDVRFTRAVLDEVNVLRASGCKCPGGRRFKPAPPLVWDEQLEKVAQRHAEDMNRRSYFSHDSKDGTSFSKRVRQAGYDWHYVGENIAMGYPTAEAVVRAWRTSKDHCPNLMSPNFKDMGVGKAGPYWVQDLGAR
ncbi:MAG: CAP domain-containing protein [Bacteroidetes bacterium]|nr:MAG: CAP domain-containing protein [Bacteroidota bacterium]